MIDIYLSPPAPIENNGPSSILSVCADLKSKPTSLPSSLKSAPLKTSFVLQAKPFKSQAMQCSKIF